jgi:hypothetical protein
MNFLFLYCNKSLTFTLVNIFNIHLNTATYYEKESDKNLLRIGRELEY